MAQLYEKKPSNADLKAIVGRGETVLHRGRPINKADELPSDVDLAGNDVVKRQHALGDLQAQRDALDKQIAEAAAQNKAAEPEAEKPHRGRPPGGADKP